MKHEIIPIQVEGSLPYARMETYFLDNSVEMKPEGLHPVILLCPGGGYRITSDREAEPLAIPFLSEGYHVVILRYSVAPALFPTSLLELAKTVAFLRENASKYFIDKDKIIVQGSSAGGHLAASLGVFWNKEFVYGKLSLVPEDIKPNGLILSYPVITFGKYGHISSMDNLLGEKKEELAEFASLEMQVTEDTPKTFIWHTFTDDTVPVQNALLFANALVECKIPVELHIYPVGGHGLSLAGEVTRGAGGGGVQLECQSWLDLAKTWLKGLIASE